MTAMSTRAEFRASQESDAHVVSRRFRDAVRGLLILALVATIFCLLFYREAAHLAAIPIPFLYVTLAFINYFESRSRTSVLRRSDQAEISREETEIDTETIGIVTLLKVLGMLALGTFIIAAALFDMRIVGVAAAAAFLLAVLINLPYLPLFVSESERDELEKLEQ